MGDQAFAKLEDRDQVTKTRACQEDYMGFRGLHDSKLRASWGVFEVVNLEVLFSDDV